MTIFFGILACYATVMIATLVVLYWPVSDQRLFRRRLLEWEASCRARGLTPEQKNAEYLFRYAMARLRRVATDRVLSDGLAQYTPELVVEEVAREQADFIAASDRKLAKKFIEIVKGLPLQQILYPAAMTALRKPSKRASQAVDPDLLAALNTLRN